jgi:hypothetical protein
LPYLTTVDSSLRYLLYPQLSVPGPYADGLVRTAELWRILRRERPNVLRIDAVFTACMGYDA